MMNPGRFNSELARTFSFGPFHLIPLQRLLLEREKPLRLGSRALEILIALVERHNELVTKEELMAGVWPNVFVESSNLTVHIAALRRVLGDGLNGNRYLVNIPGRGYRFVAPGLHRRQGDALVSTTIRARGPPGHFWRPRLCGVRYGKPAIVGGSGSQGSEQGCGDARP
jgi:DNA-binding winged helix-turn-helix (wHTH) protein